jgi:hypothetical protein
MKFLVDRFAGSRSAAFLPARGHDAVKSDYQKPVILAITAAMINRKMKTVRRFSR